MHLLPPAIEDGEVVILVLADFADKKHIIIAIAIGGDERRNLRQIRTETNVDGVRSRTRAIADGEAVLPCIRHLGIAQGAAIAPIVSFVARIDLQQDGVAEAKEGVRPQIRVGQAAGGWCVPQWETRFGSAGRSW